MKKIWILFIVAVFLLTGCANKPPMPTLKSEDAIIDYELGSYTVKTFNKTIHADAPAPPHLVAELEPIITNPESTINIKFGKKPQRIIVSEWGDGEEINQTEIESNTFNLPKEKGMHILSFRAEWKNDSATYAFIVAIE